MLLLILCMLLVGILGLTACNNHNYADPEGNKDGTEKNIETKAVLELKVNGYTALVENDKLYVTVEFSFDEINTKIAYFEIQYDEEYQLYYIEFSLYNYLGAEEYNKSLLINFKDVQYE